MQFFGMKIFFDIFRHQFFQRQIDEHKKSIDFSDLAASSTDYVEVFLKEQQRRERTGKPHTFTSVWVPFLIIILYEFKVKLYKNNFLKNLYKMS